jgi:hypothetical protein
MTRAAQRRLAKFFYQRKLLFVEVSTDLRVAGDRVISTHAERDGATIASREYNQLLRDIIACVNGGR